MKEIIRNRADIFSENAAIASKAFFWEGHLPASAFAASMGDRAVTLEEIKDTKKIVSKNASAFSALGCCATRFQTAATLLKTGNTPEVMCEIKDTYKIVRKAFGPVEYSAVVATIIHESGADAEETVERMKAIRKDLKKKYPFKIDLSDLALIAIMAVSNKDVSDLIEETGKCYNALKPTFFNKNELLSLCMVLSLYDEPWDKKCDNIIRIKEELKAQHIRISGYNSTAVLAPLAMSTKDQEPSDIALEVKDLEKYLSKKKTLGGLTGVGKKLRNMYAASIIASCFSEEDGSVANTNAVNAAIIAVITEQIAIAACIAASSAAAGGAASAG